MEQAQGAQQQGGQPAAAEETDDKAVRRTAGATAGQPSAGPSAGLSKDRRGAVNPRAEGTGM